MLPVARCLRLSRELLFLSVPSLGLGHRLLQALAAPACLVAAARVTLQLKSLQETNSAMLLTGPATAWGPSFIV